MTVSRLISSHDVLLRERADDDNEALYRLFGESRHDLLSAVASWNEAQQQFFLRSQFQTQQDQYRSQYPDARFDVIVADGEVIGNFYVAAGNDEFRLLDVNLCPRFRNCGIGGGLLQDLLAESERTKKPVSLHVIQGNPAIRLYRRMGFKTVAAEDVYRRMEWRPAAPG